MIEVFLEILFQTDIMVENKLHYLILVSKTFGVLVLNTNREGSSCRGNHLISTWVADLLIPKAVYHEPIRLIEQTIRSAAQNIL